MYSVQELQLPSGPDGSSDTSRYHFCDFFSINLLIKCHLLQLDWEHGTLMHDTKRNARSIDAVPVSSSSITTYLVHILNTLIDLSNCHKWRDDVVKGAHKDHEVVTGPHCIPVLCLVQVMVTGQSQGGIDSHRLGSGRRFAQHDLEPWSCISVVEQLTHGII